MEIKYNEIKLEVQNFISLIENDDELRSIMQKHYKGTQILLSPLYHKPKIMMIGINPGAGFHKTEGKNVLRLSQMKFMEYVGGGYMLARQTRKLFKLSGLSVSDLKNSVKTNCCFFATTKAIELNPLLKSLEKYEFKAKSQNWINKLIEIVEPKLIICEGKTAFDELTQNKKCTIKKIEKNIYLTNFGDIQVIGYSRNRSYIKDIEKVAILIKEKIAERQ